MHFEAYSTCIYIYTDPLNATVRASEEEDRAQTQETNSQETRDRSGSGSGKGLELSHSQIVSINALPNTRLLSIMSTVHMEMGIHIHTFNLWFFTVPFHNELCPQSHSPTVPKLWSVYSN